MSTLGARQPPPVPPRRKIPVGITLNDYKSRLSSFESENHPDLLINQKGCGGGLRAARQITHSGFLRSHLDPHLTIFVHKDPLVDGPESTIGAGVEINGTMQFKRFPNFLPPEKRQYLLELFEA